jgi:hypothetical protein
MAMLLMVTDEAGGWPDAEALRQLGHLGITNVSVLEAPGRVALLVQGWAFDADTSGERVLGILATGASDVTVFHPVVQVGVTARDKGDKDEETADDNRGRAVGDGLGELGGGAGMGAPTPDRHQPERGD